MLYGPNNPLRLNSSIAFLDNKSIFYVDKKVLDVVNQNNKNFWLSQTIENNNTLFSYIKNINYFEDRVFNISFFPGFGSSYSNNQILNSEIYKKDRNYNTGYVYSPFIENELTSRGNKLSTRTNTLIYKKTYGCENPDPLFEKISNEPFEDAGNIETGTYLLNYPNEIKYPKYFNKYAISKLNSNISVFGIIEEIDGTILTEKSLKGIKCELVSSGTDSRDRSINFSEKMKLIELDKKIDSNYQNYSIESYSDEEYEDLVTGTDILLKRSFKYVNKIINGQVYTVYDATQNSIVPAISNKIIFYTEDNNNIIPFTDKWNDDDINRLNSGKDVIVYDNSDVYPSHGTDRDNSQGTGPDSMTYIGAID